MASGPCILRAGKRHIEIPNETRAAEFHAGAQNESERLGVKPSEQLGSFRMASENWREITGEHNGKTVRGRFKTDSKGIVTVSSADGTRSEHIGGLPVEYLAKRLLYELAVKAEKDIC